MCVCVCVCVCVTGGTCDPISVNQTGPDGSAHLSCLADTGGEPVVVV